MDPTWYIPDWLCELCGSLDHETVECPLYTDEWCNGNTPGCCDGRRSPGDAGSNPAGPPELCLQQIIAREILPM